MIFGDKSPLLQVLTGLSDATRLDSSPPSLTPTVTFSASTVFSRESPDAANSGALLNFEALATVHNHHHSPHHHRCLWNLHLAIQHQPPRPCCASTWLASSAEPPHFLRWKKFMHHLLWHIMSKRSSSDTQSIGSSYSDTITAF